MVTTLNNRSKYVFKALFAALLLLLTVFVQAQTEDAKPNTAEKFDAGKMIMEHIGDSHEWHILGEGEGIVALPLPVILYTPKGLDVFMSSQFHHGFKTVTTDKYTYKLEENNHIVILNSAGKSDEEADAKLYDFSITKNVASLFLVQYACCLFSDRLPQPTPATRTGRQVVFNLL